jgi:hypothetical protein
MKIFLAGINIKEKNSDKRMMKWRKKVNNIPTFHHTKKTSRGFFLAGGPDLKTNVRLTFFDHKRLPPPPHPPVKETESARVKIKK